MQPTLQNFNAYLDWRDDPGIYHIAPHHHGSFFELLYFIEGESRIHIRGRKYAGRAGDLAVYHPHMVHEEFVQPGRYRIICLRFDGAQLGDAIRFPGPKELEPVFHLPWKERFHNIFEQIVLEHKVIDEWSQLLIGSYLTQFIALLWRALERCRKRMAGRGGDREPRMSHIIDMIYNSIDGDVRLADLAGKAFLSESHFSHVFKDVTGLAPKRYVIQSKIEKAKELLRLSEHTVADVALSLGYDNPQYFSRLFKKESGLTPLEFRVRSRKVH